MYTAEGSASRAYGRNQTACRESRRADQAHRRQELFDTPLIEKAIERHDALKEELVIVYVKLEPKAFGAPSPVAHQAPWKP
eukprot:179855-Amphidinium_carterae.1